LSLSHALAQSAKISLVREFLSENFWPLKKGLQFEDRIAATITQTKDVPDIIAETGEAQMPHEEIMKYIGNVFLLRMNVNHVGSILDAPVSDARLHSIID
jgi:uncharacterized Rmd1/YagE family protein